MQSFDVKVIDERKKSSQGTSLNFPLPFPPGVGIFSAHDRSSSDRGAFGDADDPLTHPSRPRKDSDTMALPTTLRTGAARASLRNIASSSSSRLASAAPSQRRELHYLPPPPEALQRGCMPFLSKGTVDTLWNGWQNGLLERLNVEVRGEHQGGAATASMIE
jgi:hypothetical protein